MLSRLTQFSKKLVQTRSFSRGTLDLPVIDISDFVDGGKGNIHKCEELVEKLHKYGCLAIRDPRVNEDHNNEFLDMMEGYFESRSKRFYNGDELLDEKKPEFGYQVGVTPELVERARNHANTIQERFHNDQPVTPQPTPKDGKWRFFYRIGESTADNMEVENNLLPPQVIPKDIPDFERIMDNWGYKMRNTTYTLAEMLALGFGWKRRALLEKLEGASNLLAPTGSDLEKYNKPDDILAGFHYDLNWMTIHGKSRYPGLSVWIRDGTRMDVRVPDGC